MDLLKCPRCGEEYSPSYRRCPFCEEGDHPRKIKYNSSKQSGGRRVSDKKQTQSVRGAMAAVLVVVLLLLSWSLFGDKIVAKITPADDGNTPGVQDDEMCIRDRRWGWRVWCVGDDIAWLRVGKDGRLWAVNPENGFFGVAPGTSMKSNPNALISTHKDTIFTLSLIHI